MHGAWQVYWICELNLSANRKFVIYGQINALSIAYCCNENGARNSALKTAKQQLPEKKIKRKKRKSKAGTATPGLISASSSFESLKSLHLPKSIAGWPAAHHFRIAWLVCVQHPFSRGRSQLISANLTVMLCAGGTEPFLSFALGDLVHVVQLETLFLLRPSGHFLH